MTIVSGPWSECANESLKSIMDCCDITDIYAYMAQLLAGAGRGKLASDKAGGQLHVPTVGAGATPSIRIWREEVF